MSNRRRGMQIIQSILEIHMPNTESGTRAEAGQSSGTLIAKYKTAIPDLS